MYSKVNTVSLIEPIANKFIMHNDRELYSPLFAAIEQYCIDRDIIIGGAVGIDLLQGIPLNRDSFYWELYTTNVFETAKDMIDHLYTVKVNHIDKRTLFLRTELKHREVSIYINARILCTMRAIMHYKSSPLKLQPTLVDGYFGGKIYCLPEEIQIIEVYRGLYTPDKVKSWPKLLEQEAALFALIDEHLSAKVISGGKAKKRKGVQSVEKLAAEGIVVGDYALESILGPAVGETHKLQLIAPDIKRVMSAVRSIYGKNVSYNKIMLPLLDDFRLVKYVVYANSNAILEVFNSTEYELVPFRQVGSMKVANYFVMLRFMLLDIWALRLLAATNVIHTAVLVRRVAAILGHARQVRSLIAAEPPSKLFQLDSYEGVVVKDSIAKKKLKAELMPNGQQFSNYYPAIKAERTIESSS